MAEFEKPIHTKLRDGTPVMIRQIHPEDKHYLQEGLKELSLASQHYRFFSPKKALSEDELEDLTEIDHHTHDAWGAFDESENGPRPIGIARYIQHSEDKDTADFAITVVDKFHGRGLGTLLLGIIASRATDNGISRFESVDMADNMKLLHVLDDFEAEERYEKGGEVHIKLALHENPEDYPKTPGGEVFRAAHELYRQACSA